MIHELQTGLERRAVHARRRALAGDLAGARRDYGALWPETKSLRLGRRLRFLGQYADVLGRDQSVLGFERIRLLAEEAERLWNRMDGQRDEARSARRHLLNLLGALLKVVRDVGDDSAIGQTALQHIWTLSTALDAQEGTEGKHFRCLQENGRTVCLLCISGRYRLVRKAD